MTACVSDEAVFDTVSVVVPARDEEQLLPAAIEALSVAMDRVPGASAVIVADSCRDRTAQIVTGSRARDARFELLEVEAGDVGAARRAGTEWQLFMAQRAGIPPHRHWLAHTDADSTVPPHWLTEHLRLARAGFQVVFGTVEPGPGLPEELRRRWFDEHLLIEGHGHVFGANLGLSAAAYLAAGGFPQAGVHEDRHLAARLAALGASIAATDRCRVVTSARRASYVEDGFAGYLRALTTATGRQAPSGRQFLA